MGMKKCCVAGCDNPATRTKKCNAHYLRWKRYGRLDPIRAEKGLGTTTSHGYRLVTVDGKQVYEHRFIAEKSLGRKLKGKEEVLHVDGNGLNNSQDNLVICEDREYLNFIITRKQAMEETGDPSKRRCNRCGEWDIPRNMYCYRNASKNGYRFSHQQEHGICFSSPIPKEKIPYLQNGKFRHYHWRDYA